MPSDAEIDISVVQGDIAMECADAIVSPDDTALTMSGGASAALRDEAGEELYETAQEAAPLDVGEVAVTPAFDLFADYVIHAAGKGAGGATEDSVRTVVENVLTTGEELGCQTVVFPSIGGGVGGLSTERSAELISEAALRHQGDSLKTIRLIARSSESYHDLFEVAIGANHR